MCFITYSTTLTYGVLRHDELGNLEIKEPVMTFGSLLTVWSFEEGLCAID
jgi:hypothetical protein